MASPEKFTEDFSAAVATTAPATPPACRFLSRVATSGLAQAAREVGLYKETRFSDHAPLTIAYDIAL